MAAKDLGTKHACFKCGTKFYDMKKPAPICPKCGADQRESPALKPAPAQRRARPAAAPVPIVEELDETKVDEDADVDADSDEAELDEPATDDDEG
jgi:uncharacterized protein (TIGR02300 family)